MYRYSNPKKIASMAGVKKFLDGDHAIEEKIEFVRTAKVALTSRAYELYAQIAEIRDAADFCADVDSASEIKKRQCKIAVIEKRKGELMGIIRTLENA